MKKIFSTKVSPARNNQSETSKRTDVEELNYGITSPKDTNLKNTQPPIELKVKKPLNNELYNPRKQIVQEKKIEVKPINETQTKIIAQTNSNLEKTEIARNSSPFIKIIRQSEMNPKRENSFDDDQYTKRNSAYLKIRLNPIKILIGVIFGLILICGIVLVVIGGTGSYFLNKLK